jgi:hypothetical protein
MASIPWYYENGVTGSEVQNGQGQLDKSSITLHNFLLSERNALGRSTFVSLAANIFGLALNLDSRQHVSIFLTYLPRCSRSL